MEYRPTLIPGLFEEAEILSLTEEILASLVPLIDPHLAQLLKDSIRDFDESGIRESDDPFSKAFSSRFDLIKKTLGTRIDTVLLHIEARERGLFDYFRNYSADAPFDNVEDIQKLQKDIRWLLSNEDKWVQSIPARTQSQLKEFVETCSSLELEVTILLSSLKEHAPDRDFKRVVNLPLVLSRNSVLFYVSGESDINTGMLWCISNKTDLQALAAGIDFIEYKHQHGILQSETRRILF